MDQIMYLMTLKPVADMLARHKKCAEDYDTWIEQKKQEIFDQPNFK